MKPFDGFPPDQEPEAERLASVASAPVQDLADVIAEHLQELVLDSSDADDFLLELCGYSVSLASSRGHPGLECAITLYRKHRVFSEAGSTVRARMLNGIQTGLGQGPCMGAPEQLRSVAIADTATEHRWPDYAQALLHGGVHSVLAIPLLLEQGAAATVIFFAPTPYVFTDELIGRVEEYAAMTQKVLRLAVRLGAQQKLAEDLKEALKSRTAIDLAVGVIMGQQHCSQSAAFEILVRASSTRNQKLRDVALELVENLGKQSVQTHFEE